MVTAKTKIGDQLVREGIIDAHQLERAVEEQKRTGKLMGKILVEQGLVKEDLLHAFLKKQMRSRDYRRLGDILVEEGKVTRAQLDATLEMSQRSGQKLGSVLVKKGFIEERELVDILAAKLDVRPVNFQETDLPGNVATLLPEELCRMYKVMPMGVEKQKFRIAMVNPSDLKTIDILRFKVGMELEPYMAAEKDLLETIERIYRKHEPFNRNSKDSLVASLEKMYDAQKVMVELQEKLMQNQRMVLASLQEMLYVAKNKG
jgi:type IV pilus assembly protein PilB